MLAGTAVDFQTTQLSEGTVLSEAKSKGMNPFNFEKNLSMSIRYCAISMIAFVQRHIGTMYSVHA